MFETATLSSGPAGKRVWGTCVGITGEALLAACAALAPVIWPQVLPKAQLATTIAPPNGHIRPAHTGEATVRPRGETRRFVQFHDSQLYAYTHMPTHPVKIEEAPDLGPEMPAVVGALPGGAAVPEGILRELVREAAPPPHPPVARASPKQLEQPVPRMKLGGQVLLGRLVHRVEPVYPRLAIQMRIAGEVQLEAVVGPDGRVSHLEVKSGHPLLVRAAVEAVQQWVFQPTLLNGVPMEVSAPVTVTFRLGQ